MMEWSKLLVQERFFDPDYDAQNNRPLYAQDADRLVFSAPFRRLANKTQVQPLYDHDHIHHRLIHSVEVSMVGRSLGVAVGHWLGENSFTSDCSVDQHGIGGIVQAACLAHDIGNPPFGHSGEDAIGTWFKEKFREGEGIFNSPAPGVAEQFSKFEGNAQGFRLISRLEMYRNDGGMRLSLPVLAAFQKYPARARTAVAPDKTDYVGLKKYGVFESEWELFQRIAERVGLPEEISEHGKWFRRHPLVYLVEAADDICYEITDLEDAFVGGILPYQVVVDALASIAKPNRDVSSLNQEEHIAFLRARAIGRMIPAVVEAFKENYQEIMNGTFNTSLCASCELSGEFKNVGAIAKTHVFTAQRKTELEVSGRSLLRRTLNGILPIFEDLRDASWNSEEISSHIKQLQRALGLDLREVKSEEAALHCLSDYVSGMTDRYAVRVARLVSGIQ